MNINFDDLNLPDYKLKKIKDVVDCDNFTDAEKEYIVDLLINDFYSNREFYWDDDSDEE